jgi:hypothetical protein
MVLNRDLNASPPPTNRRMSPTSGGRQAGEPAGRAQAWLAGASPVKSRLRNHEMPWELGEFRCSLFHLEEMFFLATRIRTGLIVRRPTMTNSDGVRGDLFPMVRLRRRKETVFGSKEMETGFSLIAPGITLSVSIASGGKG